MTLKSLIIEWNVDNLRGALGPGSVLGDLLTSEGQACLDPVTRSWRSGSDSLSHLPMCALGVLVKAQAKRQLANRIDGSFSRVLLMQSIYKPVSKVVKMPIVDKIDEFKGMLVVMCRFGDKLGAAVLALLTSPKVYVVDGNRRQRVFPRPPPIPMSGGLIFVAEDAASPVPGVDAHELLKISSSIGALMSEEGQGRLDACD